MVEVRRVEKLFPEAGHNPAGFYRVTGPTPGGHSADGMTAIVSMGDGAYSTIINPQSFSDGGLECVMRYGNPEPIRFAVAGVLETFDYLLSEAIPAGEAIRRLRLLRAVRSDLAKGDGNG